MPTILVVVFALIWPQLCGAVSVSSIEAINVFGIRQPYHHEAEFRFTLRSECIIVDNCSPSIQTFIAGAPFDALNVFISDPIVNFLVNVPILMGRDHSGPNIFPDVLRKHVILWQRVWKNGYLQSIDNLMGWGLASISKYWRRSEMNSMFSVLVPRTPDDHRNICPELHFRNSLLPISYLSLYSYGDFELLHIAAHIGGHASHGFCRSFRSLSGSLSFFPKTLSRTRKSDRKQCDYNSRASGENHTENIDHILERRILIAIASIVAMIFLANYGWRYYDGDRRVLGRIVLWTALTIGYLGVGLCLSTMFSGTWSWLL
jgi:hypothetical protein